MAVRFSSASHSYSAFNGMPAGSAYTICCWHYISVDRNTYSGPWGFSAGSSWFQYYSDVDGTTMRVNTPGGTLTAGAAAVDTWYFSAIVVASATSCTTYFGPADTSLATASSATLGAPTLDGLGIGDAYPNGGTEWWNGMVAAFKMWGAALTENEVAAEFGQYVPVRTANLLRFHPLINTGVTDYSGNGNTLSGGTGATTSSAGPPIRWGARPRTRAGSTPVQPTVDVGKDVFGTAGFEFSIQAVEAGGGITDRSWTVVSGPAEVATEIGTTSLLSWFPATAGVYELEYRVTNPAGEGYDTVFATVNAGGTIVNSASISGTGTTLTCNKPTNTAAGDVMLAVQSGDFNDLDLMTSPNPWQPLFEYDVGLDNLHVKGWTLTTGSSEPASYNFTQGTGSAGAVTIVAMRGVVEGGVRREIVADTGTTATRTCPTVEGAVPGSILLCGAMTDPGAARTWTAPSGMTEQADLQSGTATTHSVASLLNPADPTGTKDFTLSGTTVAPGGIQWSAVFPMPPDPQRRGANKSMFTVVKTR